MRILFDENMPRPFARSLVGHDISSVRAEGWLGRSNGRLIAGLEGRFDLVLTGDKNFMHHTNLTGRDVSLLIVPTVRLGPLRANASSISRTIELFETLPYRAVVAISWRGERVMIPLDRADAPAVSLPSVPAFDT